MPAKMFKRIEILPEKKLIGKKMNMSFANNLTAELWKYFMQNKSEIKNILNPDLYSIQFYGNNFSFEAFNATTIFEKWAAAEVTDFSHVPAGFETMTLPTGSYAVFLHTGSAATAEKTFTYIFSEWLPQSGYELDNRPHFEILGERYKNNDPSSQEEVWIPVKQKHEVVV